MADPPPEPVTGEVDRGSATGPPRWVKVFGIIALALVVLVVIALLSGGGAGHGPGRHSQSDAGSSRPSSVTEHGGQRP